jgi:hypothetical protein
LWFSITVSPTWPLSNVPSHPNKARKRKMERNGNDFEKREHEKKVERGGYHVFGDILGEG